MPGTGHRPGDERRILVVGGGPCGLACANELSRLGHRRVVVLEASSTCGGLAGSVTDDRGFTWDRGGHVVFSSFGEFDRLLVNVMGDDVLHHDRSSFVVGSDGRRIPYPFQHHLHHLPPDDAADCVIGLVEANHRSSAAAPAHFEEWLEATFGGAIVRHFLGPYNRKVWATPLDQLGTSWMADRVAAPDWRAAVRGLVEGRDRSTWGPNSQFAYPAVGGTGEPFRRLAARLGPVVRTGSAVIGIDAGRGIAVTDDEEPVAFDHLVWTGALDRLVDITDDAPAILTDRARSLRFSSVTVVGVGYRTPLADDASWLYFPDPDVAFYRATNMAKYSPANVPDANVSIYSSWMTEVARPQGRPPPDDIGRQVDADLRRTGIVPAAAPTVSVHVDDVVRAYPVPTVRRDESLRVILPWFEARGVHPRGRFGLWRYETGNMDHAVKMGVDVARRILFGESEELLPPPCAPNDRA